MIRLMVAIIGPLALLATGGSLGWLLRGQKQVHCGRCGRVLREDLCRGCAAYAAER